MARDGRETTREPGEAGEDVGSAVAEAGAELGSLFAQLRVSHRVAVWRADVTRGLAYLSVLDLPEEADPTWLLEHIRAQYGPGRYKLRPVGPTGKYQPGQATVSIADDRRVGNPGTLVELLTQLRPQATHASASAAAPVAHHEDTTRLLLGALLEGQGGERELVRSLLMRQADPTAELVRQAEHFRRLRNIFADPRADEPEAPAASNALGSPGMDQWLMQMLMGGMMGGGGGGMAGMMPPGMAGMMPPGMMPPGMMPPGGPPPMGGPPWPQQRPPAAPPAASQPASTPPPAAAHEGGSEMGQILAELRRLNGEVASLRKEVADLQYEEGDPSSEVGEVVEFPSVPGMDLAGIARQFLNQQTGGSSNG